MLAHPVDQGQPGIELRLVEREIDRAGHASRGP
jgi:hypothetical protein